MGLADLYEKLASIDEEVANEMSETEKLAAEHDAAGRIMARGFADELNKISQESMKFKPTEISPSSANLKDHTPKAPPEPKPGSIVNPSNKAGTQATQKKFKTDYRE
jgi:hypothetical protein